MIGHDVHAPDDPIHRALVTASSEQPDGPAEAVRSPQSRCVHGARGAPPGRAAPGRHRWMSDPAAGFPAWIRLDWPAGQRLGEVRLVFDTGLHRHLTLSHHDGYTAKMQWGRAQAETVADYELEAFSGGRWETLASVRENHRRLCRHPLDPAREVKALRVVVRRTHGIDHARLVSIQLEG